MLSRGGGAAFSWNLLPVNALIVVDAVSRWLTEALHPVTDRVEIVTSRDYLTDPQFAAMPRARVVNLCRSYKYQSTGYYVSLLAAARGHRPMPSVSTMQDLKLTSLRHLASADLQKLIHTTLGPLKSESFVLSIYFGRNLTDRYDRLARALYNLFPAPMLRARFRQDEDGWLIEGLAVIGSADVPEAHRPFVLERLQRYLREGNERKSRERATFRYDLAILRDPAEPMAPSSEQTLEKFSRVARDVGLRAELIGPDDYGKLTSFDALFIRATTAVNHFTYRFARRAEAEGLFVIDDPKSILRCTNKVYLAELLTRHHVATPNTVIFTADTCQLVAERIGFPCVVKLPDSAFSAGVMKFDSADAFHAALPRLFERSDLLLAQAFVPTDYDWRIGVLGGKPIFAVQYHMARHHWQIVKHHESGEAEEGRFTTVPLEEAPTNVVRLAVRAAGLIGEGLYGVDLKVLGGRAKVIEINDNPNIDLGVEDQAAGKALYTHIMQHFVDQLDIMRQAPR